MAAPSLRETQRWLAGLILDPSRLDGAACAPSEVVAADDATARIRLGAYTGGYPARIEEALAEAFPAVRHVLGGSTFHALLHRYLPHVPAGIYNLNDVGAALPEHLATDPVAADVPLVVDLSRLELAVQRAFHATLEPPFDPPPLAAWTLDDWDAAVLRFQPGVALVRSPWPIHDVWAARTQPRESIDIVVEGRPQRVLVYRAGQRLIVETIDEEQAAVLARLMDGETLGSAMEALATSGGTTDVVGGWLAGWVGRGLLAGCDG
jgi:hypothetical protein